MAISLQTVLPTSSVRSSSTNATPEYHLPSAPSSLAILGPLPRSSAIHIALGLLSTDSSGQNPEDTVLILSKSEHEWTSALERDGDPWFKTDAGKARLSKLLDRVNIRYAPTATHLALLLSLLSTESTLVPNSTRKPTPVRSEDPTRLESIPRLIILHELSSFFGELTEQNGDNKSKWRPRQTADQSQYGSLLTLALSTVDQLNERRPLNTPPTQLLLLDTQALSMTLPIILPPAGQLPSETDFFSSSKRKKDTYPELDVRVLVERFIDWVGIVQPIEPATSPTEQRSSRPTHKVIVPCSNSEPSAPVGTRADASTAVETFWFCEERDNISDNDARLGRDTGLDSHRTWVWCDGS